MRGSREEGQVKGLATPMDIAFPSVENAYCEGCPPYMKLDRSNFTYVCQKGYYEYFEQQPGEDKKRVCKYCGDINRHDVVDCSTQGLILANLPLKDGFWRSDTKSSNIVETG